MCLTLLFAPPNMMHQPKTASALWSDANFRVGEEGTVISPP